MKSRRRSNSLTECSPFQGIFRSRSHSQGDLQEGNPLPSKAFVEPTICGSDTPMIYGKRVFHGEGLYEGFLTFDGLRVGQGCMKGYDVTPSSNFKAFPRAGSRKHMKYEYEGTWEKDMPHGFGVYKNFESGDRYEGSFKDGKRDGLGVFLWGNGDKYTGSFENGMMHGLGRFEWFHGDVYHGMWSEGKVMGDGFMLGADGSQSEGGFQDGLLHGWAKKIWRQGDIYFGYFHQDLMNNYGTYQWKDGHRYEGTWKGNKFHGIGHYFTVSKILPNSLEYATFYGDYKVGFQCGLGHVEIQDSGSAYAGEVLERIEKPDQMNNDKHRTVWGLIFYENGVTYEGECMDCIRGGYGVLTYNKITAFAEELFLVDEIVEEDFNELSNSFEEEYLSVTSKTPLDIISLARELELEEVLVDVGGRYCGYFKNDIPHGEGVFELCNGQRIDVKYNFGSLVI